MNRTSSLFFKITALSLLFCCFFVFTDIVFAKSKRDDKPKVLILNSYHKGYDWSDNIVESIETRFEDMGVDVSVIVEYMDLKYNDLVDVESTLYELYKTKYSDLKFEVIISSDNLALEFLLKYRDDLFKSVPIIFCGVNGFEDSMVAGCEDITGVAETLDLDRNFDVMMKLYPDVKDIIVICEESNEEAYKEIVESMPKYDDKFNFTVYRKITFEKLIKALHETDNDRVILMGGFSSDGFGDYIDMAQNDKLIDALKEHPVFCFWRSMIGYGFLGGVVCDSRLQGRLAADRAIEVLAGKDADEIEVLKTGSNKPIFDYNIVKHFRVPVSKLPADSYLMNEPESFYYQYRYYIWLVSGVFVILSVTIFLLLINIFRRQSAEKALRVAQRHLRSIIDSSSDMAWLKDKDGRFIAVNETYANCCGLSVDDVVGKKDEDLWPREFAKKYVADDKKIIESKERLRKQEQVVLQDGRAVWLDSLKNPIFDDDGNAVGTSGISRDVTDDKAAEEALATERNLLRTLIDNIPAYIYVKDRDGRFTVCNAANISMLGGGSEDQVIGKTDYDFFDEEHSARWFAEEQAIMKTGKPLVNSQEPSVGKDKGGWTSVTKVALKDGDGNIVGLVGINTDITQVKKIENDLQKASQELEKRVTERTSQLAKANEDLRIEIGNRKETEEKLLVSQSQLRSLASELSLSEERLRRKIATDVHDNIGQNLAMLKIKLGALRKNVGGSDSDDLNQLLELISQTISLTRTMTFEISPPVLYELGFEPAMEWLVRNARDRHGFDAEFESDDKDKPMSDDVKVLLFQAVRELLVNVAKHAKASMVTVISERQGENIRVRVIDDGVGFDVGQARNKARVSNGFGLFSIRERLGFIGGALEIESKSGEGTKVVLKVPIKQSSDN